jgi:hypothetical protein
VTLSFIPLASVTELLNIACNSDHEFALQLQKSSKMKSFRENISELILACDTTQLVYELTNERRIIAYDHNVINMDVRNTTWI